jgi:sterol O-acyltransferase
MKKSGIRERRRSSSLTNNMIQDMELDVLKEKISNKHKRMVKEIDEKLDKIFDDFLNEITKLSLNRFEVEKLFDDGQNGKNGKSKKQQPELDTDKKSTPKNKLKPRLKLPEKIFQPRNSLLTDLFEIKHIRTIYHTFIVIFNLLLLNVFVSDFADTGTINIGLGPIVTGFAGIQYAIGIWLMMQITVFTLYPSFLLWANITRKFFMNNGILTSFWHFIGVIMVITYHAAFIYFFTKAVVHFDMAHASSVAVLMELVRFLMKSYAFIRTNVPRVLNSKNKLKVDELGWDSPDMSPQEEDTKSSLGTSRVNDKRFLPSFGQFAYFLFAPTLVYRDEYPRTKQIRWKFVAKNFLEVVAIIFIYSLISERIMYPVYNQFGSKFYNIEMKELLASVFNCMLPGLLCFLCGFYCILHSWQNAFAEMLRFADRKFYSDWWNSSNFSVYYRTWNIIVHDWLYLYVYKDLYENFTRRNVVISQLLVFSLSAIVHEYILGFTFKFFYPILFCQFQGAGVLLIFITKKEHKGFGNIFMWLALAMGMGMLLSMYHMEVYARMNCEYDQNDFYNLFYPISWTCNGIKYSESWEMKIRL